MRWPLLLCVRIQRPVLCVHLYTIHNHEESSISLNNLFDGEVCHIYIQTRRFEELSDANFLFYTFVNSFCYVSSHKMYNQSNVCLNEKMCVDDTENFESVFFCFTYSIYEEKQRSAINNCDESPNYVWLLRRICCGLFFSFNSEKFGVFCSVLSRFQFGLNFLSQE